MKTVAMVRPDGTVRGIITGSNADVDRQQPQPGETVMELPHPMPAGDYRVVGGILTRWDPVVELGLSR